MIVQKIKFTQTFAYRKIKGLRKNYEKSSLTKHAIFYILQLTHVNEKRLKKQRTKMEVREHEKEEIRDQQ